MKIPTDNGNETNFNACQSYLLYIEKIDLYEKLFEKRQMVVSSNCQ